MPERHVVVRITEGLHARPAALFSRLAAEQPCPVTIRKPDGAPVPAGSILSIMALGARAGDEVVLEAADDGPLATLAEFLEQVELPAQA